MTKFLIVSQLGVPLFSQVWSYFMWNARPLSYIKCNELHHQQSFMKRHHWNHLCGKLINPMDIDSLLVGWGGGTKPISSIRDDLIKWKHFPHYWPFVQGIHRSPVDSPHKGQWRGALMFSLICVWINDWVNNHEAGELRHHRGHYDVTVMSFLSMTFHHVPFVNVIDYLSCISNQSLCTKNPGLVSTQVRVTKFLS